jgi:hypothetical protein
MIQLDHWQVRQWNSAQFFTAPFNPKPKAMADRGKYPPNITPAIASGFGLNEDVVSFTIVR